MKMNFMISGLPSEERDKLSAKIAQLGGKYNENKHYTTSCTHVICGKILRSEKYLAACVEGKPILVPDYVHDSHKSKCWLPHARYEWNRHWAMKYKSDGPSNFVAPKLLREDDRRMFEGWNVVVLLSQKSPFYKRLLQLGKCKTYTHQRLTTTNPDLPPLTHVFVDKDNKHKITELSGLRVPFLRPEYITEVVMKGVANADMTQFLVAPYTMNNNTIFIPSSTSSSETTVADQTDNFDDSNVKTPNCSGNISNQTSQSQQRNDDNIVVSTDVIPDITDNKTIYILSSTSSSETTVVESNRSRTDNFVDGIVKTPHYSVVLDTHEKSQSHPNNDSIVITADVTPHTLDNNAIYITSSTSSSETTIAQSHADNFTDSIIKTPNCSVDSVDSTSHQPSQSHQHNDSIVVTPDVESKRQTHMEIESEGKPRLTDCDVAPGEHDIETETKNMLNVATETESKLRMMDCDVAPRERGIKTETENILKTADYDGDTEEYETDMEVDSLLKTPENVKRNDRLFKTPDNIGKINDGFIKTLEYAKLHDSYPKMVDNVVAKTAITDVKSDDITNKVDDVTMSDVTNRNNDHSNGNDNIHKCSDNDNEINSKTNNLLGTTSQIMDTNGNIGEICTDQTNSNDSCQASNQNNVNTKRRKPTKRKLSMDSALSDLTNLSKLRRLDDFPKKIDRPKISPTKCVITKPIRRSPSLFWRNKILSKYISPSKSINPLKRRSPSKRIRLAKKKCHCCKSGGKHDKSQEKHSMDNCNIEDSIPTRNENFLIKENGHTIMNHVKTETIIPKNHENPVVKLTRIAIKVDDSTSDSNKCTQSNNPVQPSKATTKTSLFDALSVLIKSETTSESNNPQSTQFSSVPTIKKCALQISPIAKSILNNLVKKCDLTKIEELSIDRSKPNETSPSNTSNKTIQSTLNYLLKTPKTSTTTSPNTVDKYHTQSTQNFVTPKSASKTNSFHSYSTTMKRRHYSSDASGSAPKRRVSKTKLFSPQSNCLDRYMKLKSELDELDNMQRTYKVDDSFATCWPDHWVNTDELHRCDQKHPSFSYYVDQCFSAVLGAPAKYQLILTSIRHAASSSHTSTNILSQLIKFLQDAEDATVAEDIYNFLRTSLSRQLPCCATTQYSYYQALCREQEQHRNVNILTHLVQSSSVGNNLLLLEYVTHLLLVDYQCYLQRSQEKGETLNPAKHTLIGRLLWPHRDASMNSHVRTLIDLLISYNPISQQHIQVLSCILQLISMAADCIRMTDGTSHHDTSHYITAITQRINTAFKCMPKIAIDWCLDNLQPLWLRTKVAILVSQNSELAGHYM